MKMQRTNLGAFAASRWSSRFSVSGERSQNDREDTLKRELQPRGCQRAFTLIELLLVLVILGILAAIVVPKFSGRTEQARNTAAQSQISTFGTALNAFVSSS